MHLAKFDHVYCLISLIWLSNIQICCNYWHLGFGSMRGCRSILAAAPLFLASRSRKNGALSSISSGFCNLVESQESLELPDWFMYPEDDPSYVGSDDEFVLPPEVKFSDYSINSSKPPNSLKVSFRAVSRDITDFEVDVEQISRILNSNFSSPEAVLIAIDDGCSIRISKPLVDKILQRFNNDWVPAFGFFMWAGTQRNYYMHSADTYDVMVDILGKFKQFDTMWGLIEEMVRLGGLVSLATMTKVMRRLAGAGRWSEAINAFNGFEHFGVEKDTQAMNVLLDTLCKERSVRRARDAFLELRSEIPPDASSFNTLVHGWCKAQKLEEARETMKEMRQFGFYPCVITYTSLIEAYCLDKNFTMVDAVLDEMHAQGCNPNVVTYTIVMHSLGKAKKTQEALEIFDKMKKDGCIPDTSFYNSLIYILGRAGWLRDANNIFEEMCGSGISPNVNTFNTLISAFCDHSQEENALKLLVKMEETSCKPDVKTYTPLLKLCCKRQWVKILYFLLGHMLRKDISPDFSTYTLLVNGLCRNGKLERSCLFFEQMVLRGLIPNDNTYNMLMGALERKNMDKAKRKIHQLMIKAETLKPPRQRAVANRNQTRQQSIGLS
ncbi:pentatricopeptide repeat-containing protein At3g22670, mitochondrial-like [Ananas comosus]|uniref:Pentatricopeptide repeat-containing protein At3g22670, mitochondrial-like n=1 Tax=Ananas comosus TaxID=4615 RepID=A0A6P5G1W7_ANACO|nr:pentatricopeptide repeat-containing protein At3g22670, mitochondrial-like [Ananas comosus]